MTYPNQPPPSNPQGPRPAWGQGNSAWGQPPSNQWPPAQQPAPGIPATPRGRPSVQQPGSQPLGQHNQPSVSLDQFRPKRNRSGPIALAVAGALVFSGILYFGLRPDAPGAGTAASPTPSRTMPSGTPSVPTAGEFASAVEFQADGVSGRFTINESRWEGSTLVVDVTVQVDDGILPFDFMAMDMVSGEITLPNARGAGDIGGITLNGGSSATGTARFNKPRGDTQILLTTGTRSLAMLGVKG